MRKPPRINIRFNTCTLPSSGKKVRYQPFLIRHQELLAEAKEIFIRRIDSLTFQNEDDVDSHKYYDAMGKFLSSTFEVIMSCFPDLDPSEIAEGDLPYLLSHLRKEYIDNELDILIPCSECKGENKFTFKLDELNVNVTDSYKIIDVVDNIQIKISHIQVLEQVEIMVSRRENSETTNSNINFDMVASSIKEIIIKGGEFKVEHINNNQLILDKELPSDITHYIFKGQKTDISSTYVGKCVPNVGNIDEYQVGDTLTIEDEVINFREYPFDERREWLKSCPEVIIDQIIEFLKDVPGYNPISFNRKCENHVFTDPLVKGKVVNQKNIDQITKMNEQFEANGDSKRISLDKEKCQGKIEHHVKTLTIEDFL